MDDANRDANRDAILTRPLTGGATVEPPDADNPNGESYSITTPVFDDDYAYFASGLTLYRASTD